MCELALAAGLAYLTFFAIAFTNWSVATSFQRWVVVQGPLLTYVAVLGLLTSIFLFGIRFLGRHPFIVILCGLAPVPVNMIYAALQFS